MDRYLVLSIVLNLILIIILFSWSYSSNNSPSHHENITTLLRQTARWLTASLNDSNPYIANLHANYAQGYFMALTDIYPDAMIQKVSGVDTFTMKKEIAKGQDNSVRMLAKVCPEGKPKQEFLANLAKY